MAVSAPARACVQVRPISESDVGVVAEFLHMHLNKRVAVTAWVHALDVPWPGERPNAGFMLLDGGSVVGAHLAYYSERSIEGRHERICNLGAWCVLPSYRFHALRLLKALLAQDGYHFTDLSPSGNVVGLNTRLGFRFLDTSTTVVPGFPWPSRPRRGAVSADRMLIEQTLDGDEAHIYRDHARTAAARHLVLIRDDEWCYVMFRKDRRKGLPLFASILHVSNPPLFRAMARSVACHLLLHHGAAAMLLERAVVDHRPRLAVVLKTPRRKMFLSPTLELAQIDYLYSELVCLPW